MCEKIEEKAMKYDKQSVGLEVIGGCQRTCASQQEPPCQAACC